MKIHAVVLGAFLISTILASEAFAQVPVTPAPDQSKLLASSDPKLAANKKLVYDFWRVLVEARHVEEADKYLTETYIQHNPRVPSGRKGFVDAFSKRPALPIQPTIKGRLVNIVAEGDYVVLSFMEEHPDPQDASKSYTTTAFDMLRIENGKVAEHWDSELK